MNHLQYETSPYLLQHQYNPVDWFPWKDEALQKARSENKMLIISVGYAACHWCHVMEHESFEDEQVAEVMNDFFVSIKVDREERPDIDQIYMNAAMITTGHGGWPLNVIALPDGRPVFAGTYFPKQNWLKVLLYFAELYKNEREKLVEQATHITEGLHQVEHIPIYNGERLINDRLPDAIWNNWKDKIDYEWGGRKGAPKFMMPNNYDFLLRYFYHTKNEKAGEAIKITFKKMAFGGLFDILGGGFARYSVDAYWKVPHFEKMLYDNGQLMSIYSMAYQLTKRPLYKNVVEKTFAWLEREMTDESGGLYASLDADSEGVEGKFYCWTKDEINAVIQSLLQDLKTSAPGFDLLKFVEELYNITAEGNFEHGMNVLFRTQDHEYFMEKYNLTSEQFHQLTERINDAFFEKRTEKIRPHTDDKILTEWNAIAIKGLTDAYKAFSDQRYLDKAICTTEFILKNCKKEDHRLDRNFKNGKSGINGFLQDYAFFMEALISLYQVSLEEKYLLEAQNLAEYVLKHFYNSSNGMFYITSDLDTALITRSMDSSDNVIPAGNSTMAKILLLLSKYFDITEYEEMSRSMLNNILDEILKNPTYFSNWAIVLDMHLHLTKEIVVVGKDAPQQIKTINAKYLPHVLTAGSKHDSKLPLLHGRYMNDKTLFYLCENKSCGLPEENPDNILKRFS
jgi:uncharacterized protein YyaL (SSP411 family)